MSSAQVAAVNARPTCPLDEFFVLVDRLKGAEDTAADLGRSAMLNTKREHLDGSLQGELVFVDFERHGREQV